MNVRKWISTLSLPVLATASITAITVASPQRAYLAAEDNPCAQEAIATDTDAWVCMGDTLSWNAGTPEEPKWKDKKVEGTPPPTVDLVSDDGMCEWIDKCSWMRTDYHLETKGNALFGDQDGPMGAFDVIWDSFHGGAKARWRLHLKHEWGKAVNTDYWMAWEVEENFGPDGWHCYASFGAFMPTIWDADGHRHAWAPSETTERACSEPKDKKETWHDDLNGRFKSDGITFQAGMLHTGHWRSWVDSDGEGRSIATSKWDY